MEIKEKLKYLRKINGWSTTILAQKAGVAQSTISHIEGGRNKPSLNVLKKITNALGVSIEDFLNFNDKVDLALKIKNKKLLDQFNRIRQLNKKDRETIEALIDTFLKEKTR